MAHISRLNDLTKKDSDLNIFLFRPFWRKKFFLSLPPSKLINKILPLRDERWEVGTFLPSTYLPTYLLTYLPTYLVHTYLPT